MNKLNLGNKSDTGVQPPIAPIKGLDFNTAAMTIIRKVSVPIILAYKLDIANSKMAEGAKPTGLKVPKVESSAFGMMMDTVGKFLAVVAVAMSVVVDRVLDNLDIVDVVKQTKTTCNKLDGSTKDT